MNAYELADKLKNCEQALIDLCNSVPKLRGLLIIGDNHLETAANMLRQQADRIAELEKELNHMQSFYGCDPAYYGIKQSKPVAWMNKDTLNLSSPLEENASWINPELMIPLYTHPAKTLTDEEILNCWFENGQMLTIQQARIQFARAILRKASEK